MALPPHRKVLVVDSEPAVCSVIGECISEWPGTEVSCVTTGQMAALALQAVHYDLVLTDAILPDVSALSLLGIAASKRIPVLIFSGHPEALEKLDEIGCPCVAKPFSIRHLIESSRKALEEAQQNIDRAIALASKATTISITHA